MFAAIIFIVLVLNVLGSLTGKMIMVITCHLRGKFVL